MRSLLRRTMERDEIRKIPEQELRQYLSEDELALPGTEREELLIQRKLVNRGLPDEMDLITSKNGVRDLAGKNTGNQTPEYSGEQEEYEDKNGKYNRVVMWLLVLLLLAYLIYKFIF
jgi:hypothetical protein